MSIRHLAIKFTASEGHSARGGSWHEYLGKRDQSSQVPPKMNYFELKNGTELTFDRNISLFSKPTDVVSIVDRVGNEAHIYGTGSRTVVRATAGNRLTPLEFYDQAGVGIHVPVNHSELPSVLFENKTVTPQNLRLFNKLTNSFCTGNMRPLAKNAGPH